VSLDTLIGLLGIAASFIFMIVTILVTPGLTILIDRTVRFRQMRSQLLSLLNECKEHIKTWLRSRTRDDWEEGRDRIYALYLDLGRLKEAFPVIGGGKAESAQLAGEGYLIGSLQMMFIMMFMNSQGTEPTEMQKAARSEELKIFSASSSELKEIVDEVETFTEFRAYLVREIWDVYKSLSLVFISALRKSLRKQHQG
jgi:hypothetical protein